MALQLVAISGRQAQGRVHPSETSSGESIPWLIAHISDRTNWDTKALPGAQSQEVEMKCTCSNTVNIMNIKLAPLCLRGWREEGKTVKRTADVMIHYCCG
jgi:hypothetical protein